MFQGGGFFGSGAKSTTTTNYTTNDTKNTSLTDVQLENSNLNLQNFGDLTAANINISTTDFGAISAAMQSNTAVAAGAFDFGRESMDSAFEFGVGAVDGAYDLVGDVLAANSKELQFFGEQTAQAFDRSMAFAQVANTSENAQFLESGIGLLKMGAVLIIGGAAAFFYFSKKA